GRARQDHRGPAQLRARLPQPAAQLPGEPAPRSRHQRDAGQAGELRSVSSASAESTSAGPARSGARRRLSRGTVLGAMIGIAALRGVAAPLTKNWAEADPEER